MRGEGLHVLSSLLARYRNLRAPQGTVVVAFLGAVKEVCGVELQKHVVRFDPHSKTLFLTVAGPARHEILLHAKDILLLCTKELGRENAPRAIV